MIGKKLFVFCLIAAVLVSASNVFAAKTEAVELSAAGKRLEAKYSAMLKELQGQIKKSVPAIDKNKSDAFMASYASVGKARGNAWRNKGQFAATFKPVAEAQAKTLKIAKPILSKVDSFLSDDKLDDQMIKCAVLANATPAGLAAFAQKGVAEEILVDKLLADTDLMKQMLEAGGARLGKYGEAMQIYTDIHKTSKLVTKGGIFERLALATSLELAAPLRMREDKKLDPVSRYMHYEKALVDGELDPQFKNLTAWECRFVVNCGIENKYLSWAREMLRNYRPDHILTDDYRWRYSKVVKTDVKYGRNRVNPGVDNFYQGIMITGGVCGKRAFFGRYVLKSFGIPTFGVRQRRHAAVSHWTPDGWTINFGAGWVWSWWDRPGHNRSGEDFLLETQVREYSKDFVKVLRAQWVGDALGEADVNGRKLGSGGLWNALGLYLKKAVVAEAKPIEVALAGEDIAEANESTKAEKIFNAEISDADRKIETTCCGWITIPATACSSPTNSTKKITFMKSFSGGMQLHYNRLNPAETFEYTFDAPKAGKYKLNANVVTVTRDQNLLLTVNKADKAIDMAVPYTAGMWKDTEAVEVELVKGQNVLSFTRPEPCFGITIKDFTLKPVSTPAVLSCATVIDTKAAVRAFPSKPKCASNGKLKIFVVSGQSNMVGFGQLLSKGDAKGTMDYYLKKNPKAYGHLVNKDGSHVVRDDAWIVDLSYGERKGWLTTGYGKDKKHIGPEYAFGFAVADYYEDPVLIIKSAWGGRSLSHNFLPPSSETYPKPLKDGDKGFHYSEVVRHVKEITSNLKKYYPSYDGKGYEIVGFGWHQGWNDRINADAVNAYAKNMENFIKDIRKDLGVKKMPFVIANTGIGGWTIPENAHYKKRVEKLMDDQLSLADGKKYPAFKGNVAGVETRDFQKTREESPSGQGFHWLRNWETYYQIGQGMGDKMVEMLN